MKRVAVIGGGVAGMQTALRLAEQGVEPVIIEKEAELGGKLRGWHKRLDKRCSCAII